MNTRFAAPVFATVSLAVLLTGCAGAAAQGGHVRDDLSPLGGAAALGIARGQVIVKDDLSPLAATAEDRVAQAAEQAAQAVVGGTGWGAEARRELHAPGFRADAPRAFSAEARRELHSRTSSIRGFTADVMRELKGSAPSPTDTVDDDLSPLGGIR